MSGLMGSVMQGAALGTGSAIAHRAVDSMMGPRTMHVEQAEAAPAAAAPQQQQQAYGAPAPAGGACAEQAKQFAECMSRAGGDMGGCQFYFDAMQQCKLSAANGYA